MAARLLVEFLGTFLLALVIGMTALDSSLPAGLGPIAVASVLASMIYATSHVSGAHFNPVVTLAFTVRGTTPLRETGPFIAVQLIGAVLASLLSLWAAPPLPDGASIAPLALDVVPTLVFETIFTFAMVFVILNLASARPLKGNQFSGLAVGLVVLAGAYVAGPVSGAAFNPAVTVALGTMGVADWSDVWMHFCGEFAGAMLALAAFTVVDRESTTD